MAGNHDPDDDVERIWVPSDTADDILRVLARVSGPESPHAIEPGTGRVSEATEDAKPHGNEPHVILARQAAQNWPYKHAVRRIAGHTFVEIVACHATFKNLQEAGLSVTPEATPAAIGDAVEKRVTDPGIGNAGENRKPSYRVDPADRDAVEPPRRAWRHVLTLGLGIGVGAAVWPTITDQIAAPGPVSWASAGALAIVMFLLVLIDQAIHLVAMAIWHVRVDRDTNQLIQQFEARGKRDTA